MEEKKEAVEKTVDQPIEKVEEIKKEQPRDKKGRFKSAGDDNVIKIDLSKPPLPPKSEEKKEEVVKENVVEEVKAEVVNEPEVTQEVIEQPVMEEVTEEAEQVQEAAEQAVEESIATGNPLPENVQKLVDFMDETGGDINDYVNLNRDTSKMDDSDILDEYYKSTKSHLSPEERSFLLEETYGIDEDVDDEKAIRMKKIALKEQVAEARAHLDRQKSKYYEDIKAGSKLTEEQQKAIDFFNRHNKESEQQKKLTEASKESFLKKTDNVFNENFKGFDFRVGDKKYRYNVKDAAAVKDYQSDISNFVKEFLDENNMMKNAAGYHKALYAGRNIDKIVSHFYEQGRADAIKETAIKSKNIDMGPRTAKPVVEAGGVKFRVLGGDDSSRLKFKIKKK